jgi:hypothetical protein
MECAPWFGLRAGQVFTALVRLTISYYITPMKAVKKNVIRKKMGRRPIGEKAADVYAFRLPAEAIETLDAFAKSEGIKERGAALRRLIEEAKPKIRK